ncbi:MAG: triose-phosphate isomerase [Defluviitaleaceae bacterium]|nr:triose-phosphate isomerase [Defluviitaleaceae bacterium]
MRKKLVAGNWKMNLPAHFKVRVNDNIDVVLFVPFTHITECLSDYPVILGAQNLYPGFNGAFTGEVSAGMIRNAGAEYVLVGHSERRSIFGEANELINKKVKSAIDGSLRPLLCVGETLEEREKGITMNVISEQIKIGLNEVDDIDIEKVIIAYEPVWAIGTGKTATSAQAEEICKAIRELISEMYSSEVADDIRILYGGSVNGKNAKEIFSMPNIDGGLVGGASLNNEFNEVIKGAV